MSRTFIRSGLLALAAFCAGIAVGWLVVGSEPQSARAPLWGDGGRYGPCAVARVIDGDTIDVVCGGIPSRVRLLNVDTPERGQPGYEQARSALELLVENQEVYLDFEKPGEPSRGAYGRLLAYVVSHSGMNLNLELIREGWSPFYTKYGKGRFPESFARAEIDARRGETGLWAMR